MKKIFVILTVFLLSALVPLMAQETGAVEQPALSEGALEASEVSESLSDEITYDDNEVSYNPEDDFYGFARQRGCLCQPFEILCSGISFV